MTLLIELIVLFLTLFRYRVWMSFFKSRNNKNKILLIFESSFDFIHKKCQYLLVYHKTFLYEYFNLVWFMYLVTWSDKQCLLWRKHVVALRVVWFLCTSPWFFPYKWAIFCRGWPQHRKGRNMSVKNGHN